MGASDAGGSCPGLIQMIAPTERRLCLPPWDKPASSLPSFLLIPHSIAHLATAPFVFQKYNRQIGTAIRPRRRIRCFVALETNYGAPRQLSEELDSPGRTYEHRYVSRTICVSSWRAPSCDGLAIKRALQYVLLRGHVGFATCINSGERARQ